MHYLLIDNVLAFASKKRLYLRFAEKVGAGLNLFGQGLFVD